MKIAKVLGAVVMLSAGCGDDAATSAGPGTASAASGAGGGGGGTSTGGAGGGGGAELPTGQVEIGFWCGLPASELTKARMDEIKTAGFTFVMNACDGTTFEPGYDQKMLSLAEQDGLRALVADTRIGQALGGVDVEANLSGVVADYGRSPALLAYYVTDEPSAPAFAGLGGLVAALHAHDAEHMAFINLLPDYATAGQLGTATYDDYIAQFVQTVKPEVVSYDHYNFLSDGSDGPTFFQNLAVVRKHALQAKTPFWQIIQSISYNGHRAPTGPEKRWAALHTLAYGGTGVMYFTYWTPNQTAENFGDGIIGASGQPSSQYEEVRAINETLTAMGRYLAAATSETVFHNGPLALGTEPRASGAPVYLASPAPITVGIFSVGSDAYALLVNRDHGAATESDVYFASADGAPEVLDVASSEFALAAGVTNDALGSKLHVTIPPGDGILFHLRGPIPTGAPGAEAFFGTVRADAGWLDVVDASFGTARLRQAGWDDCPSGYENVGHDFQSNGFWLCARPDLVMRTFYVGNVVNDTGTMYSMQNGAVTNMGAAGWDSCPAGTLVGHRFESNGFWVCME